MSFRPKSQWSKSEQSGSLSSFFVAIPDGTQPCYDEERDGFVGRCEAENCCEGRFVISGLCPDYPNNFKCCFRRNLCAASCGKILFTLHFFIFTSKEALEETSVLLAVSGKILFILHIPIHKMIVSAYCLL